MYIVVTLILFMLIVGGLVGIPFASSGLSQIISREEGNFEIYPDGTMPLAAFLKNETMRLSDTVTLQNATTVTFAETSDISGEGYNFFVLIFNFGLISKISQKLI